MTMVSYWNRDRGAHTHTHTNRLKRGGGEGRPGSVSCVALRRVSGYSGLYVVWRGAERGWGVYWSNDVVCVCVRVCARHLRLITTTTATRTTRASELIATELVPGAQVEKASHIAAIN